MSTDSCDICLLSALRTHLSPPGSARSRRSGFEAIPSVASNKEHTADCRSTIRRFQVLDVESFAALLTDSYPHCWLIAAAVTGDRVEADDIVQEASLIALDKLADFT